MSLQTAGCAPSGASVRARVLRRLVLTLLAVEFLDELVFGSFESAWPLLRADLRLGYAEIGLLLALPRLFGNLVEPALGVLGDVWDRRALVLWGGALFAASLALVSASAGFWTLLLALLLISPAGGAFVGLSQAALMDLEPARREQNMARWGFAGSLAQAAGSLSLGAAVAVGPGWRALFAALAALSLAVLLSVRRLPLATPAARRDDDPHARPDADERPARDADEQKTRDADGQKTHDVDERKTRDVDEQETRGANEQVTRDVDGRETQDVDGQETQDVDRRATGVVERATEDVDGRAVRDVDGRATQDVDGAATRDVDGQAAREVGKRATRGALIDGLRGAWRALRRREVLRWLVLLELADLMLDGFHGFIALYFVDAVGVAESRAAFAVSVWTGVGLAGDLLVIPLLERVRGLSYLRLSAAAALVLLPAFLVAPGLGPKLVLLALLGVGNSGWYPILKAQLHAALPGRGGTVMALHSTAGIFGAFIPLALGLLAERFGLARVMWLLLAGPVALLALIPRRDKSSEFRVSGSEL
jgi:predicted MFS family arabinose efflux permease